MKPHWRRLKPPHRLDTEKEVKSLRRLVAGEGSTTMTNIPYDNAPNDEDLKRRVLENLDVLDRRGKLQMLDFSRELAIRGPSPKIGDKGGALLAFAGSIPKKDLEEIGKAIEEDCEKVDLDEW